MEELALKTGHLTPGLLKKDLAKMEPPHGKIYVTHLKPQYFKIIEEELPKLGMKHLRLLKEGKRFGSNPFPSKLLQTIVGSTLLF